MKKIALILLAILMVSCSKDDQKWNSDAMISLNPAPGTKAGDNHLTALEIVQQAWAISFYNETCFDGPGSRGFADNQRDFGNVKLLMFGRDIITQNGEYLPEFIEGHSMVLTRNLTPEAQPWVLDTIAYIPNSVLSAAKIQIKAAYESGEYETVYSLFNTAFTFIPITGAEWRALDE